MKIILATIAAIVSGISYFMRRPQFGSPSTGDRLKRIRQSKHFAEGSFQNLHDTPNLKEGVSVARVMKEFFFDKSPDNKPSAVLPSRKVDLNALPPLQNTFVWFGHSSYFLQVDRMRILVDPVFSGNASPLNFTTKSFAGSDVYQPEDMPEIDLLIITHDHWDHLDYETVGALKPKIKKVVTGLGVGAHLERWGFGPAIVTEMDWNESAELGGGFKMVSAPARHFSGRNFNGTNRCGLLLYYLLHHLKFILGAIAATILILKPLATNSGPLT